MKKSVLILLTIIILILIVLLFIAPDGSLSIGELLILVIGLIIGVLISDKVGE